MAVEVLYELHRVTEWRNGAIYKTEYVEDVWVPHDAVAPEGTLYVAKSSSYQGQTIRSS